MFWLWLALAVSVAPVGVLYTVSFVARARTVARAGPGLAVIPEVDELCPSPRLSILDDEED